MSALRSMSCIWSNKVAQLSRQHHLFRVAWSVTGVPHDLVKVERNFHSSSSVPATKTHAIHSTNVSSRFFPCIIAHNNNRFFSQKTVDDSIKAKTDSTTSGTGKSSKNKDDSKSGGSNTNSWFSGKHAWKLGLVSLFSMGCLMCGNILITWGAPATDKEGNVIPDKYMHLPTWQAYLNRAWEEFHFFKKMIQEPSSQKLLPDPVKEPWYQPPYTLVIELTGVLVHPDWTLSTGWRFKKRPAIDYFLQQVGPPLFEVVVYTHEQGFTAFPIIDGLDPKGYVSFRLFRDATRYQDGTHVKDLDCLNRDLSKVIIVDCDPKAYKMHSCNAVPLKKWTGADEDRTLVDLAHFLKTIATSGVEDVRTVLDHYNQFEDPIEEFKQNQIRLQEEMQREAQLAKEQQEKKSLASAWGFGLTGRKR